MRRQLHGCQPSQVYQPKPLDLLIEADPFRRSEGPLAASSQMLRETTTNVPVDVSEGLAWIPKVEVVLPALQVPVQPLNQLRDRLKALPMIGHLVQLLPLLLQSFRRRTHIQIPPPAPLQVLGVAERESQKVQTRSFFLQIHHPRFLPIDLQPQPAFELRFNPPRQSSSLIARQHHEVVGISHHLGTRPLGWPIGSMKQLVEPMQIHVTEQRRNHPALGTPFTRPTPSLRLALLTRLYDWGLQPHPDQLEHTQIGYTLLSSGEIPPPWGLPLRGRLHRSGLPSSPGSTTGVSSHIRISLSTLRSTTRMRTQARSLSCGIESK